jgi:hypothetical protein
MALNDGEAFQYIAKRCLDAFSEDAKHIAPECAPRRDLLVEVHGLPYPRPLARSSTEVIHNLSGQACR